MKTSKTPQEKFKTGLKKSGYDPDAGAKRLLNLIAKQKKEREEFESKYKSAYEGREMKTLKQIVEGTVVMSDYKLDKRGKKYKAHRSSMGRKDSVAEGSIEGGTWSASAPKKGRPNVPAPSAIVEPIDKNAKDTTTIKLSGPSDLSKAFDRIEKEAKAKKGMKEDVEQVDELKKSTLRSYLKKAVDSYGHSEFVSRAARDPEEKASAKRTAGNRAVGIIRANKGLKSAHTATMKEDVNPYYELDEARGRPAGAATLAKRAAAAAAKPRNDDDDGDNYDADSGVEADQHIHVQLKKAVDSDEKPFQVSFRNGKKHSVSQKVAKDLISATDKLKPQDRKEVHDHIHQSYDNLVSVHRMVVSK